MSLCSPFMNWIKMRSKRNTKWKILNWIQWSNFSHHRLFKYFFFTSLFIFIIIFVPLVHIVIVCLCMHRIAAIAIRYLFLCYPLTILFYSVFFFFLYLNSSFQYFPKNPNTHRISQCSDQTNIYKCTTERVKEAVEKNQKWINVYIVGLCFRSWSILQHKEYTPTDR